MNKNGKCGKVSIAFDPRCLHFLEVEKKAEKPIPQAPPTPTKGEQEEMMRRLKEGNPVIKELMDDLGLEEEFKW